MTGSILLSDIAEKKRTKLVDKYAHLRWCEQLIKRTFPHCAPANLETCCLLEIGDFSRRLRFRCSCQFLWCAPGLNNFWSIKQTVMQTLITTNAEGCTCNNYYYTEKRVKYILFFFSESG
jgi:hypothetical protein